MAEGKGYSLMVRSSRGLRFMLASFATREEAEQGLLKAQGEAVAFGKGVRERIFIEETTTDTTSTHHA